MTDSFRSFVIFAEMRTGSNLLEATLNEIKKVTCFGEAFNPYMMGWPDKDELYGITFDEREKDPLRLLNKLLDDPGHLPGFRYFHDHDPRVLDAILDDRRCAKIILTRNPLDSYISTLLARETDQWKLNETEFPIPASVDYDGAEFRQMLTEIGDFQQRVLHRLQSSGQAGFWLKYDDLRDTTVMTGLLHWLGRTDLEKVTPASHLVPQNPRAMQEKVTNFEEMQADLQRADPFALESIPDFESRRGPAVPSFITSEAGNGLIYMPVQGATEIAHQEWFKSLGEVGQNHTQSSLRRWKRQHPDHRGFTILRHPVHRAWNAFQRLANDTTPQLRKIIRDLHRVPLPPEVTFAELDQDQLPRMFRAFVEFLGRNLNGQTSLPTHPYWASQSSVINGFGQFAPADLLIRENRLASDVEYLCESVGIDAARIELLDQADYPDFLNEKEILDATKTAYMRDYIAFGFSRKP